MMDKLEQLREVLDGHSKLLIIPHNDPDPDAIAAALAPRRLRPTPIGADILALLGLRYAGPKDITHLRCLITLGSAAQFSPLGRKDLLVQNKDTVDRVPGKTDTT